MSPGVPGIPGDIELPPRVNVYQTIHALSDRTGKVEVHVAQLVKDVGEVKDYLAGVRRLEAMAKHLMVKGFMLIVGAVGGTYGITRGTAPAPTQETVKIVKSATTVKVEACTAMQPGPERDKCALDLLAELMVSRR